ncbi:MAG: ricin-type beta-trefoil lectin domain protein [candidate division Zixibacteria bacterium]|nr:ricin-type beta-trefoil lectin domain protein [candidate division Zixibacteria bacterium]
MKKIKTLVMTVGIITFILIMLNPITTFASKEAWNNLVKGYDAFKSENYHKAIEHLLKSYGLIPDPKAAYYLSRCYFELEDANSAYFYAQHVLTDKPQLDEKYMSNARKLANLAQYSIKTGYRLGAKLDNSNLPELESDPLETEFEQFGLIPIDIFPIEGKWYNIVSVSSNKCLDVASHSIENGANISQWRCHGKNNQLWRFQKVGNYYMITPKHSNKCLDVAASSNKDGGNISQWECHGGNNQLWTLVPVSNVYMIVSKHSNKCLDVAASSNKDGGNISQWECHGGDNQLWRIIAVD